MPALGFPVLDQRSLGEQIRVPWPDYVPWALLEPHEARALRNHDQTLKRLAQRSGLSLCEMLAIIEDRPWHEMTDADSRDQMATLVAALEPG